MGSEQEKETNSPLPADQESVLVVTNDFLGRTSAHGLPHLASGSLVRKILWAFIFLAAFVYFIYQFQGLYKNYKTYPTGIRSKIVRRNDKVNFPAVTICNSNILKKGPLKNQPNNYTSLIKADQAASDYYVSELKRQGVTDINRKPDGSSRKKRSVSRLNKLLQTDEIFTKSFGEEQFHRARRQVDNYDYGSGDIDGDFDYTDHSDLSESYAVDNDENISDGKEETEEKKEYDDKFFSEDAGCVSTNPDLCSAKQNSFDVLVEKSRTSDFSDLLDMFNPTWDDLKKFGHKAKDLILECSYDNKPCSYRDFDVFRTAQTGNCFVFNSKLYNPKRKIRRTIHQGTRYGLKLTFNVEADDYIGLFAHEVGVRITVHDNYVHPHPTDDGVSAGPGVKTSIGINQVRSTRLPYPYKSECETGDGKKYHLPGNYNQLSCEVTCLREALHDNCSCYDGSLSPNDKPVCGSNDEACVLSVYKTMLSQDLSCDCRPPCSYDDYDVMTSTVTWPSDPYYYYLQRNGLKDKTITKDNYNDYLEDMGRVHIYIDNKDLTTIEEFPAYPWDRLLADLGGLLGLFIGVSVCTVLEIVEFIIDLILYGCRRRNKNKQVNQNGVPKQQPNVPQQQPGDTNSKGHLGGDTNSKGHPGGDTISKGHPGGAYRADSTTPVETTVTFDRP